MGAELESLGSGSEDFGIEALCLVRGPRVAGFEGGKPGVKGAVADEAAACGEVVDKEDAVGG